MVNRLELGCQKLFERLSKHIHSFIYSVSEAVEMMLTIVAENINARKGVGFTEVVSRAQINGKAGRHPLSFFS